MTQVTAMGCSASSLIGAFLGVKFSPYESAVYGMAVMGLAGEKAKKAQNPDHGPGSFRVAFLDALANLNVTDLTGMKVTIP